MRKFATLAERAFPDAIDAPRRFGYITACQEAMRTQFAWVIELAESPVSSPQYWAGSSLWTGDNGLAIRFARKQDAQQAAQMMLDGVHIRICEHGWDNCPWSDEGKV